MSKHFYARLIESLAPGYDAGQVEAFMRLEYGTLDHLSREKFAKEVTIACACIDADPEAAKQLAASYGF